MASSVHDRRSALDVLEITRAALARVLEVDPVTITPAASLRDDLGADSLALVELAELLEERADAVAPGRLRIPDRDLERLQTVGELVDYVTGRL